MTAKKITCLDLLCCSVVFDITLFKYIINTHSQAMMGLLDARYDDDIQASDFLFNLMHKDEKRVVYIFKCYFHPFLYTEFQKAD